MSYRDRDRDRDGSYDKGSRYNLDSRRSVDAAPKVFVGNLPYTATDDEVKAHFESCGKVVEVLIPRDHNHRIKGYGFITFEDFDSMDRAIRKLSGSSLLGNTLRVDRANERKERSQYDNRAPPGRYDDNRSGYGERRERKPIGYRCRVAGLGGDIGWQLLKDFLRQAGDVTYANVDPDGLGVGEYQTLAECRDAIEKLSGAALDGNIVKLTPLNFDIETGERLDRVGGDRGGGYNSRGYDDTDRGRGDYRDSRDKGREYSPPRGGRDSRRDYDRRDDGDRKDYGGGSSRDYDRRGGGRDYSPQRSDRGGGGGGSYRGGSPLRGGGAASNRDYDRDRERDRDFDRGGRDGAAGGGYDREDRGHGGGGGRDYDRDRYRDRGRSQERSPAKGGGGGGGSGRQYDSPRSGAVPAAGGSSRYGGGGGGWAGGSSKYGGGGAAGVPAAEAAPPAGTGGSSRYGGGDRGYRGTANGGDGSGDGYGDSRGGGGPDRGSYRDGRGSDRHGPYDRPASGR